MYIWNNYLLSTNLVIWGSNLQSTVKERFSRTELAMVKLPINAHSVINL